MPSQLYEQKFCGWCGIEVSYFSKWASECSQCKKRKFINPNPCNSMLIVKDKSILVVKRNLEPGKGKFDLPGGFMEVEDSSLEEAAYREIQEELSLSKEQLGKLTYMGSDSSEYTWNDVVQKNIVAFFRAELLVSSDSIKLDLSENTDMIWANQDNLNEIDFSTEIEKEMVNTLLRELV